MTRDMEEKAEENFPITMRDAKACIPYQNSPPPQLEFKLETRQYVGVLFVIPVIMTIQNHRFEIFTLVSEIHENVDLVIAIKNLF